MTNTAKPLAKTLMIQGTTSDAGKSTLVTGLCRLYARRQVRVAPFKPQNMALNSAVTPCGGEIGRAQAVQAKAANLPLEVDFNPILLKPNSDTGAQVIIHGRAITDMQAQQYHDYKKVAAAAVHQSHQRLMEKFELIVVEGAGSPAEINLRAGDIANMGFAEHADCPVIIIADIDKGGVFAHLVGTLMLLSPSEQQRVVGFVINRFRGDIALLNPGLRWLEQRTNKPVLGVLPYLHQLAIAAEDAISTVQTNDGREIKIRINILVYPRTSNHTDFDALRVHPEIDCRYVFADLNRQGADKTPLPACDLIILPGSKNVRADLAFLRQQGWDLGIAKHLRYGGKVLGICGGFQMLGELIADPLAIEGEQGESTGLGYFPMTTELKAEKTLLNVSGILQLNQQQAAFSGYEIHAGESRFSEAASPLLIIDGQMHGAISADQQVAGCYVHGLFDQAAALVLLMSWLDVDINANGNLSDIEDDAINRLADACEQHLDMENIAAILANWYQA